MGYTTSNDSEAAHLCEIYDDCDGERNGIKSLATIVLFRARYVEAKAKKVNEIFACACCGKKQLKKQYSQAFCPKKKCKDRYWNTVDDERRERAKRFK